MEDKVCQYSKFGYCKYTGNCKRIHYSEVCEAHGKCNNINGCERRHPKRCKRFANGINCRFENSCAFSHQDSIKNKESEDLKEKVQDLQNTVTEMTIKMTDLEKKLDKIMKANVTKERKNMEDITEVSKTQKNSASENVKVVNKVTKEKENSKLAEPEEKGSIMWWNLKKSLCPVINVTSNV